MTKTTVQMKSVPQTAAKQREMEIEQCLAAHGLERRPRHLTRHASAVSQESYVRHLRAALASLGPVFSAFGLYLSSRVDLLAARDCLALAAIADRASSLPLDAVRELIAREFGCALEEAFAAFEEVSCESRLLFQSHRAWLLDGRAVTVKVAHPAAEAQVRGDLEGLSLLKKALLNLALTERQIESVLEDFRCGLEQQHDLFHEAESLQALAQEAREFELLRVPAVHSRFCSPRVLTIERLSGTGLGELLASLDQREPENEVRWAAPRGVNLELTDLASRLCLVWLRQSLLGSLFPVEPGLANVVVLQGGQIAFTGGSFARLPPDSRSNLLEYLLAVASEYPERASERLLAEMKKGPRAVSEDDLQLRFRQIVPFRDGGWSEHESNDSLAEHLFVQWRFASEGGYQPLPHLLGFYRGLFAVTSAAHELAPASDPLREALENLRFLAALAPFGELIGPRQWGEQADKYAALMMALPEQLDEVLRLAAEGSARLKFHVAESVEQRRRKNSLAAVIALLLALAAGALLTHHFAVTDRAGVWSGRISAIVFVLLGVLLLRTAGRLR